METTYIENGLLRFKSLKNDKFQILTTYDNKIWGNMNNYFSIEESEKERIKINDEKIQASLNTNLAFALTTPQENTVIDMNDGAYKLITSKLDLENSINFIPIRANGIITYPRKQKASYIFAPIDCPIVVITDKKRSVFLVFHLGAPQVCQKIYGSILDLALPKIKDINEFDCFITPYICKKHYSINQQKYDIYLSVLGEEIKKYTEKKYNELYKEDRYYIDFVAFALKELRQIINIDEIFSANMCTYEEAKNGNLFSHEYTKELHVLKSQDIEKFNGSYNVIVNI